MAKFDKKVVVMKIFSAEQIRECDQFTIKTEPVSSINLMERAAQTCTNWLEKNTRNNSVFYVFCGNGNNGGDGFAVARMLYHKGFDVEVFMDEEQKNFSSDAKLNLDKIRSISGVDIHDFSEVKKMIFRDNTVIIDALFGTGLNRKIEGRVAELIQYLNQLPYQKISVDIPSGLLADGTFNEDFTVFKADETLSFQFWKQSFLHPETGKYCGNIHLLDIGLSGKYIHETESHQYVICDKLIGNIFRPRIEFSHKGNYGKTCIVAGSFGVIGAAVLSTKAALKTGSGLTYVRAPKCGYEILQTSCPEAMYLYGGEDFVSVFENNNQFTFGIGPGLGTDPETEENFINFLSLSENPLVLDADALNIISKQKSYLDLIPKSSVITPHPREFERLFGPTENSFERLNLAKEIAKELQIFIILKDHHTQIITPKGEVYYNITGNSGMAKGGSGDVLTGIVTSLISQNYPIEEACVLGVWLHGKAGDIAAEKHSKESLTATDLIEEIGSVYKMISHSV